MSDNDRNIKEVFISYSTKDGDDALYLCNLLEGAGISCWIAPRDIPTGQAWAAAIMKGLEECKVVAFLSSSASLGSKEVAKEIDIANGFRKEILPVRLQNIPLTGEFAYHLSSRQWVDAHDGERSVRFQAALNALLKLTNRSGAVVVAQGSVLGQARSLVTKLNHQYSQPLGTINAMFSAHERPNFVSVYFPLRIGATGVDLFADFNHNKKTITICADAATDGDVLKGPFGQILEKEFKEQYLPQLTFKERGRRWGFVTLVPENVLAVPWLDESPEACFPRFADYVTGLYEAVMPRLLDWSGYASEIDSALEIVEKRLRIVFPEEDGWRIGAPEGSRLNGFRATGKINLFKESWAPRWDNYNDRGHLTITLEADGNFLRGLKIGVLKYDTWLDLGDFGQAIFDAGKNLLPNPLKQQGLHDRYALQFSLSEEWRDCGLADAKLKWRGNLDQFVDYVVQAFTDLKPLENILGQACHAIPALQDKDISEFSEDALQRWDTSSALYVRNRLRLLSERMQQLCKDTRIDVQYRYHYQFTSNQYPEWVTSDLLLMVKVGNFDIAIAFEFSAHWLNIRIVSIDLPDFESGIATAFLKARHPGLSFEGIPNKPTICHGLSVTEWMNQVQQCIESRVGAFIPALDDLATHLEQCKALTEFSADMLRDSLPVESGWIVENNIENGAVSLEAGKPISIYRKSWLTASNGANDLPTIRLELVPNLPCFDDLYISVKLLAQPFPELDRAFGQVFGACEFAFGPHEQVGNSDTAQVEWAKRLDPLIGLTGGSDFTKRLLDDEGKAALASHLQYIAASILKMEPMLAHVCQKQMAVVAGDSL